MSTSPTIKMSCMLKHFRSCVSAEVEQLCLLAKLRVTAWVRGKRTRAFITSMHVPRAADFLAMDI